MRATSLLGILLMLLTSFPARADWEPYNDYSDSDGYRDGYIDVCDHSWADNLEECRIASVQEFCEFYIETIPGVIFSGTNGENDAITCIYHHEQPSVPGEFPALVSDLFSRGADYDVVHCDNGEYFSRKWRNCQYGEEDDEDSEPEPEPEPEDPEPEDPEPEPEDPKDPEEDFEDWWNCIGNPDCDGSGGGSPPPPSGGGGSGAGDWAGSGAGGGEGGQPGGSEDGQPGGGVSGSCATGFICNGDAVQCSIYAEQVRSNCSTQEVFSEDAVNDGIDYAHDQIKNDTPTSEIFNVADFFDNALNKARWMPTQCVPDDAFTALGVPLSLSWQPVCDMASYLAPLIVFVASMFFAVTVVNALRN